MTEQFKVNVSMDLVAETEDEAAQMFQDIVGWIGEGVSGGSGSLPDGRGSYTFKITQNKPGTKKGLGQRAMEIAAWWHGLSEEEQNHWESVAESDDVTVIHEAYLANKEVWTARNKPASSRPIGLTPQEAHVLGKFADDLEQLTPSPTGRKALLEWLGAFVSQMDATTAASDQAWWLIQTAYIQWVATGLQSGKN